MLNVRGVPETAGGTMNRVYRAQYTTKHNMTRVCLTKMTRVCRFLHVPRVQPGGQCEREHLPVRARQRGQRLQPRGRVSAGE